MPNHPLAEVFGFPADNLSPEAAHCRAGRLCPFKAPKKDGSLQPCTKDKKEDPLGVCSVFNAGGGRVITCPVRFQQEWLIARDAARFFFPSGADAERVTEVRLTDQQNRSVGSIDVVLYTDAQGRITDYGSVEVQAVYISGNIRRAFAHYMEDPAGRCDMDWRGQPNYPRADFLSSSRKRLAPQLISKGGILNGWGRKIAVVLDTHFYNTLSTLLEEVDESEADMAWLVYDLLPETAENRNRLTLRRTVYTKFASAVVRITQFEAGNESVFIERLNQKAKQARKAESDDAPPGKNLDPNL